MKADMNDPFVNLNRPKSAIVDFAACIGVGTNIGMYGKPFNFVETGPGE